MRRYGDVLSPWFETENLPSAIVSKLVRRLNFISAARRWATRYGQRAVFEQLDDHLLDDIGIDVEGALSRWRQRQEVLRRGWLAGFGGFS